MSDIPDKRQPDPAGWTRLVCGSYDPQTGVRYTALQPLVEQGCSRRTAGRLALVGPELLKHPNLPELIASLADKGHKVWIESTALAFSDPRPAALLKRAGLTGIRWLYLADDSPAYRELGVVPSDNQRARILKVIRTLKLKLLHVIALSGGETDAAFAERLAVCRALVGDCEELALLARGEEAWTAWLSATPPSEAEQSRAEDLIAGIQLARRVHDEERPAYLPGSAELRASLLLGTACNLRCRFCYIDDYHYRPTFDAALAAAERLMAAGCTRFHLSGGEPTLWPDLPRLVEQLRRRGAELVLESNGLLLDDAALVATLRRAGLREVKLSLHSFEAEVYARLCGRSDALARILAAAERCIEADFTLHIQHTLCAETYRHFAEFIDFYAAGLHHAGRSFLSVSNLLLHAPVVEAPDLIPRYRDLRPEVERGLLRAAELGISLDHLGSIDGFPDCVFGRGGGRREPTDQHRLAVRPDEEGGVGLIITAPGEALERLSEFEALDLNAGYLQPPACASCARRKRCLGVQKAYLDLYGDEEFSPLDE